MKRVTEPQAIRRVAVPAATAVLALVAAAAALPASAANTGWLVRGGIHQIDPKSDNGTVAGAELGVDSQPGPTFNIDYYFTPNLAVDVLAALPFKHDISLNGADVGSVKHLPPTVSLQYHLMPDAAFDPYLGVGLNYTFFMDEKLDGGGNLKLDDSFGLAAQAGVDFKLGGPWLVGVDVRYIDIDSDVKLDGTKIGTAHIDPITYGVTVGYRF